MRLIGVGNKPSETRGRIRASARFPKSLRIFRNVAGARRSIEHSGEHPVTHFRQERFDVELALDARREICPFLGCAWILQVIQCAAVGEARYQCAQLQRRHLNSLAKTGHARHSAKPVSYTHLTLPTIYS